jgi:hypothetical protein
MRFRMKDRSLRPDSGCSRVCWSVWQDFMGQFVGSLTTAVWLCKPRQSLKIRAADGKLARSGRQKNNIREEPEFT